MATFQFKRLEEYALKLSNLVANTEEIAGKAIYKAAGLVTDAVRKNIESLPERKGTKGHESYGTPERPLRGVTPKGKKGLLAGLGITPLGNEDGYWNVKIGFDGYNTVKTKKYPRGQPNQLVARGVESGTSWLEKTPFVAPAVRKTRKAAIAAMQEVIDTELEKHMT